MVNTIRVKTYIIQALMPTRPRFIYRGRSKSAAMFIQTESTPNPATLKFLPGQDVMGEGAVADFPDVSSAGRSPLAKALFSIPGGVPIAGQWPVGCRFHPRCPQAEAGRCDRDAPALQDEAGSASRCHFAADPRILHAWDAAQDSGQGVTA